MAHTKPLSRHLNRDTVSQVVHEFYRCVLADPVLATYFAQIDDWPEHESHITDFWWGLMGGKVDNPRPNAMAAGHHDLRFGRQELERWLELFTRTLLQNLPADIAEQWGEMARQVGLMMAKHGMLDRG